MGGDLGLKRASAAEALALLGKGASEIDMDDCCSRPSAVRCWLQRAQAGIDPGSRGRFIVKVAIDPISNSLGAQRRQSFVESPAGFTEIGIGAIAQRQYRVPQIRQAGGRVGHQRAVEGLSALGRVALAPSTG